MTVERKLAVVTGGGSGVGAACAEWFARRRFDILIVYRASRSNAESVAKRCAEVGARAEIATADVAVDADCRRIGDRVDAQWGRVDALVNSAGITLFRSLADLEQLDARDFLNIYAVNLVGPYQMIRALEAPLRRARGSVVNISSVAARNGTGSSHAYAASKGALNTLTLSLARTLAPDVRVNAVLPSLIDSDWVRNGVGEAAWQDVRAAFESQAALGSISTPADIAETVGWLAVKALTVTGQFVVVDSGVTLGRPPVVAK